VTIFSFHLARTTLRTTAGVLVRSSAHPGVPGLQHMETMAVMALGSPIVSPARMQLTNLAVFAAWEDATSLDAFLVDTELGRTLASGWHVRLELLRRWGSVAALDGLPVAAEQTHSHNLEPVVAVTLARLKLPEIPRFIRWGKPVEELVRDHPGVILALAAMRPIRTVCTFSVWRSQREMLEMVRGKGGAAGGSRHVEAMQERERRDFHHEFTTLRFRALAEHGEWQGRRNIVPGLAAE
jgi:hypothetical protein